MLFCCEYITSTAGDGQQESWCDGVFHSNLNQTQNLLRSLLPAVGWITLVAMSRSFIVAVSFRHSGLFVFILQDYKADEDPALFQSVKTKRGPLGPNWKVRRTGFTAL